MYNNFNPGTTTNDLVNNTKSYIAAIKTATTTTEQPQSDFHCCNWFGLYNYLVVLFVLLTGLCILSVKMIIKTRRRRYKRLQPVATAYSFNTTVATKSSVATSFNDGFSTPPIFNWTTQNPWQFTTISPAIGGIIISDGYSYWSFYYFYLCLIMIFCLAVVAAGLARQKRLAKQKQKARQRAQENNQVNGANNGYGLTPPSDPVSTGTIMQSTDCPPTYDSAMKNYIVSKQQLRDIEDNVTDGGMTMAASTATIETCISEIAESRTDLRADSVVVVSATNEPITNTASVTPKPILQ